ncbi:MAG: hypothetical protein OXU36_11150 [Candidatus Poribacteria bacterium]|nr:hypothetical protein [Candidatus Poribacteria bacterium]
MPVNDLLNDLLPDPNKPGGHDYTFFLWPRQWTNYNLSGPFNWEIHPFEQNEADEIPIEPGIYSFIIQPGIADHPHCSYLMYLGMTKRPLRERFKEYFREKRDVERGRPKILKLLHVYQDYLHFCCSAIAETEHIKDIEDELLKAFIPPCNDEYPAEISRAIKAFS